MRSSHVLAGVMTGVALGLGGVIAAEVVTEPADAQGGSITAADLRAANERSQSAIRRATNLQNAVGKFFTPAGVRIGTRLPPGVIRQEAGTGQNGLPGSTILNGAIAREKIANDAVDSEKIAPGGVTAGDLADNSVQSAKVEPGAITGEKLAGGSVSTDKVVDGAVTSSKIAPSARVRQAVVATDNAVSLVNNDAVELFPPVTLAGAGTGHTWAMSSQIQFLVSLGNPGVLCEFVTAAGDPIGSTTLEISPGAIVSSLPYPLIDNRAATNGETAFSIRCTQFGGGTLEVSKAAANVTAVPA